MALAPPSGLIGVPGRSAAWLIERFETDRAVAAIADADDCADIGRRNTSQAPWPGGKLAAAAIVCGLLAVGRCPPAPQSHCPTKQPHADNRRSRLFASPACARYCQETSDATGIVV